MTPPITSSSQCALPRLGTMLPVASLALAPLGHGAILTVNEPILTPTQVFLSARGGNDDLGAVYASTQYDVFSNLIADLYDRIPVNGVTYASPEVLFDAGSTGFTGGGSATFGWNVSTGPGLTLMTSPGPGDPGFDYTPFTTGKDQEPFIALDLGLLKLNASSGYQTFDLDDVLGAGWDPALYDAIIVRSESPLLGAPNYLGTQQAGLIEEAFVGDLGGPTISTSGLQYLLLVPGDFAEWTDLATEHPGLSAGADANGNGHSNFLDYASGQDPAASGLLPIVELSGSTPTLRRRVDGIDALATAEYSDDLGGWHPLEESVHYTVTSNTVSGPMRTLVLELLPGQPPSRFFRQHFGH